ncbi:MAG: LamG domain-containing protein, partial [Candidatus Pacebacteria bacterium]|nr:LamG domain-containing protein [Candidatus Paceibacterota bacterium]
YATAHGKIGAGRGFDGSTGYISTGTTSLPTGTGARTIEAWYKAKTVNSTSRYIYSYGANAAGQEFSLAQNSTDGFFIDINGTTYPSASVPVADTWYHVAATYDGTWLKIYVNGSQVLSQSVGGALNTGISSGSQIGRRVTTGTLYTDGIIDEVRVSNIARPAADITAAYNITKRQFLFTNKFTARPVSSTIIGPSNTSLSVTEISGEVGVGDTIIIYENKDGVEYRAQNTVTATTVGPSTSTFTLTSGGWSGTFPPGGYDNNAMVLKWSTQWFDLTGITSGERNAITRLSFRIMDGFQGSNIWIDNIRYGGAYMTTPTAPGSTVTSTPQRYIQYRSILSTNDTAQTPPNISAVTFNYQVPGGSSTGTMVSQVFNTLTTPLKAYLASWADLGATGTINYYVSRNNGAEWVEVPMTDQGVETGSIHMYSGNQSVASQSAGTGMRWKATLTNDAKLYAMGMRWDDTQTSTTSAAGLYTGSNPSVVNGGYLEVIHGQNTSEVVATGWVYNTSTLKWDKVDASSTSYNIQINSANAVRLYNNSGITQNLRLDVITGGINTNAGTVTLGPSSADTDSQSSSNSIFINKTGTGGNFFRFQSNGTNIMSLSQAGVFTSGITNAANNIAYTLDSANSLTATNTKLLSVKNGGTEKMYLDSNGNLYVSGTITAGNGFAIPLTNKWQNGVTTRSLVVLDQANATSFNATTSAYTKALAGVVQGVEIGGDTDADGVCDLNETCLVAVAGKVNVNVTNTSGVGIGDYMYTATQSGKGVADSTQHTGMLGVVSSTANIGSGYLEMIFRPQPIISSSSTEGGVNQADITNIFINAFKDIRANSTPFRLFEKGVADRFMDSTGIEAASSSGGYIRDTENYNVRISTSSSSFIHQVAGDFNSAKARERIEATSSAYVQSSLVETPNDITTLALYKFENNGNDSSKYGQILTAVGTPAYSTVIKRLNSYSFVGSDTNYFKPPTGAFPLLATGTVETWVYTNAISGTQTIFRSSDGTNESYLQINSSGQLVFKVGAGSVYTGTSSTLVANRWYHIAATWDGSYWRLFMDGVETNNVIRTNTMPLSTSGNNYLSRMSGTGSALNGYLDDFRISGRARTALELKQDAQRYPYAVLTSQVMDIGQTPTALGPLSWTESLGSYGNVEFETRSSADNSTWEAWKPTTSETQVVSMDTDSANWSFVPSTAYSINKGNETTIKTEGTGSMRVQLQPQQIDSTDFMLLHMEEVSGTGAYIKNSGAGLTTYDMTPTGTTVVDGYIGKARNFNGSSDYLISSGSVVHHQDYFNGTAWIKPNVNNVAQTIVNHTVDWIFALNASGQLYWGRYNAGIASCATSQVIPANQWTNVAFTYNNNIVYLYINGRYQTNCTLGTMNYGTSYQYTVGRDNWTGYFGTYAYFNGIIDELRVSKGSSARYSTLFEAEEGRAGRDTRIVRTFTAKDLSSATKFAFDIAADRPGTWLEATIGESDYDSYLCDANTISLWHLDEAEGTSASDIRDTCTGANHATLNGTTYATTHGKIGAGRGFDGSTGYLSTGTTSLPTGTGARTIEAWYKPGTVNATERYIYGYGTNIANQEFSIAQDNSKGFFVQLHGTTVNSSTIPTADTWYHVAATYDATNVRIYVNGEAKATASATLATGVGAGSHIGRRATTGTLYTDGVVDEVRVSNIARSGTDIAATYNITKRQYPITVDFPVSYPLLTTDSVGSGTTTVTVPDVTGRIYVDDKIVLMENVSGTEYLVQGTVNSVTVNGSTTTLGITSGSWTGTFPPGGFDGNSKLFKWQKQWLDVTGIPTAERNALTRFTFRVMDGYQGANIFIDDMRYGGDYLTIPGGSTVTSTNNRFVQYRAIQSVQSNEAAPPNINYVKFEYGTAGGTDPATVVSKSYDAVAAPTKAWLSALADVGTGTLTYSVSRNDGATWSTVSMTDQGLDTGTIHIYSGLADLSSQTPGTKMRWKVIITGNAKLYGLGMRWEDQVVGGGNGLYTNAATNVANNGYVEVNHGQGTSDLLATGWLYNASTTKWDKVDASNATYKIEVTDSNKVRFYNYSGSAQDMRLDVVVGGLRSDSGAVSLAPVDTPDVDANTNTSSIWINKTGTGGNFLRFQSNGTDKFKVDSGGQLQIGSFAAAPTALGLGSLYVNSTDNGLYYYNGTSWASFSNLWQVNSGAISPVTINQSLNLGATATASALVHLAGLAGENSFINTGYFGIGRTAPVVALDVNGSASISGSLTVLGSSPGYIKQLNGNDFIIQTSPGGNAGLTDRVTIKNNGNVGIGDSSPTYKLQVAGDIKLTSSGAIYFADGTSMSSAGLGSANNLANTTDAIVNADSDANASGALRLQVGGVDKLYIKNDGTVGIGTTSPSGPLEVYESAGGDDKLLVLSTGYAGGNTFSLNPFIYGVSNGGFEIRDVTNAVSRVVVQQNTGNVGIGTTSPATKLDVAGSATISGTFSLAPTFQAAAGTCNTAAAGKEYYDASQNAYYYCNGTSWGRVSIPETQGQIAAFASTCPAGWTEYTAARGRYIVGTPASGTIGATVGTALSNTENRPVGQHNHGITDPGHTHSINTSGAAGGANGGLAQGGPYTYNAINSSTTGVTINNEGSVAGTNAPYIQLTYCSKDAGSDLAEWIPASADVTQATIISVDPNNNERVIPSSKAYDPAILGVVSTKAGWLIGDKNEGSVQMALAGRVPTRVTLKNGEITRGDAITSSDIPGVGMKATQRGQIIGKALEPLTAQSSLSPCVVNGASTGDMCGEVLVFIGPSYFDPTDAIDTTSTTIVVSQDEQFVLSPITEVGHIVKINYHQEQDPSNTSQTISIGTISPVQRTTQDLQTMVGIISDNENVGAIIHRTRVNNATLAVRTLVTEGVTTVNIDPSSPSIQAGDAITISSTLPGHGTKAIQPGQIIGRAVESWDASQGETPLHVAINISYFDPAISFDGNGNVSSATFDIITARQVEADKLIAQEAQVNSLVADVIHTASVSAGLLTTNATDSAVALKLNATNIEIINTTSTHPEVVASFDNQGNASFSGEVVTKSVRAQKLQAALAEIESIKSLDAQISGNATISGTLYADNINAQSIFGLDDKISSAVQHAMDTATASGAITYTPPASTLELINSLIADNDASTSAYIAALNMKSGSHVADTEVIAPTAVLVNEFLSVQGLANFNYAEFSTGLTVNGSNQALTVTGNSISLASTANSNESLQSTTLYIQPSGSGSLSLLGNRMILSDSGDVSINGNLYVNGSIYTQDIQTESISIGLTSLIGSTDATVSAAFADAIVTDSAALTLAPGISNRSRLLALYNNRGELVSEITASGSAMFQSLTTKLVTIAAPKYATDSANATESATLAIQAKANASAGTATIPAGTTEVLVTSTQVAPNTLIYLTPLSNTQNQVLYVKQKSDGLGFTVAVNQPLTTNIQFNYWIIKME